jgi:hypothetical protein
MSEEACHDPGGRADPRPVDPHWMVIVGLSKGVITITPDIGRYRRMRDM